MKPTQIKELDTGGLLVTWDDGHIGPISLRELRDSCPCADCSGESVLFRTYTPPEPDTGLPGRYELGAAEPIGGYAIKFSWKDGHDLGIYTWEHLRSLCRCTACEAGKGV